jgi:hypothetical protein
MREFTLEMGDVGLVEYSSELGRAQVEIRDPSSAVRHVPRSCT